MVALADRYRLRGRLGEGGMAVVYLAEDLRHGRDVAIKVMRPEVAAHLGSDRFLREIEIAAHLAHPNILSLYDSGEADGVLYYVMPYIAGESLRARLQREKQLPIEDALQITGEVADALSFAHRQGIVHRDIKPENILIHEGHAVVSDFGIAHALSAKDDERLTATGMSIGTPAYMSPEQAAGERGLDGRSDIYSLGCVLYEMLAGDPPFSGSSPRAILARKAVEPPPSLRPVRRTAPDVVVRALERALATVPADRFATADQFARALRGSTITGTRRRLVISALSLAVVTGSIGVLLHSMNKSGTGMERMAVLPLANLADEPGQRELANGMQEALITELGQIHALDVISRQSTLGYRATPKPMREIARELGVSVLVDGSVLRTGDSVEVRIRLIEVGNGDRPVWSGRYRRHVRNVLALQGEVARTIAGRIGLTLTPTERVRLTTERPVNPMAYDAWLRGFARAIGTRESTEECIRHASDAARLDPTYVDAYLLAASCYNNLTFVAPIPPQETFPRAKAAANRALELDPSSGRAHSALAWALAVYDWDWPAAEREYQLGLELDGDHSGYRGAHAFFLAWLGRHEEALREARRSEQLNPLSPFASQNVAMVLYLARRYDEAIAQSKRTLQLAPEYGFGHARLGAAYDGKGMHAEAVASSERAAKLIGSPRMTGLLGRMYAVAGQESAAQRILDELLRLEKTSYVPPVAIAAVYAGLRETDNAMRWLEKGFEEQDGDMVLLKTYPIWDPLRSDSRFERMLDRMNFPD